MQPLKDEEYTLWGVKTYRWGITFIGIPAWLFLSFLILLGVLFGLSHRREVNQMEIQRFVDDCIDRCDRDDLRLDVVLLETRECTCRS